MLVKTLLQNQLRAWNRWLVKLALLTDSPYADRSTVYYVVSQLKSAAAERDLLREFVNETHGLKNRFTYWKLRRKR